MYFYAKYIEPHDFCLIVSAGFRTIRSSSSGLSGGEIAGTVIGFTCLFALFATAMFVLIRPPDALKPYVLPPGPQQQTTYGTPYANTSADGEGGSVVGNGEQGVNNPIYGGTDTSDIAAEAAVDVDIVGHDTNFDNKDSVNVE